MARGRDPRSASSLNTGQILSCKFVTGMEEGGAERRMWLSAEAGRGVLAAVSSLARCAGGVVYSHMQKTGASGGSSPVLFRRRSLDLFPPVKTQLHTVLWSQRATGAREAAGADSFQPAPPPPCPYEYVYSRRPAFSIV
uniref:Uncharacterized protein n=1 Tax=Myotis myotis TaxID=51298 RepID=A0A7J7Z585_MYOMY|nr:hypothetical protein mMyoMyo1_010761 [Myotis myotis]